jgi:hypothetical protein
MSFFFLYIYKQCLLEPIQEIRNWCFSKTQSYDVLSPFHAYCTRMKKGESRYQLLLRDSFATMVLRAPPRDCSVDVLAVVWVVAGRLPGYAMLPDPEQALALLIIKCSPCGDRPSTGWRSTVQVRSCRFLYYYRQRIQNGRNIQLINIAVKVIKDWVEMVI